LNHGLVAQGTGLGLIRVEAGSGAGCLAAATDLRREMTLLGGTLVVLHSPPELRGRIDAWGPAGDSQPLMRRIKDQFDPAGIMNPGRFAGGI